MVGVAPAGSMASASGGKPHSTGYEVTVLLLLGLAFGFAYFDRMAMTFLSPYVVEGSFAQ